MNYLERLKSRNTHTPGTDKTDKRASVGFVSKQCGAIHEIRDVEIREERAAIFEFEAGLARPEAERLAGLT